ncbi:MAG: Stp1/IreP family PP2C-type Ser/Thr phosphatase [Candidatus Pelethousia sp.]|nr:Stp1/IreP family PP2C-type Ser/Thr phosphatase [Candidatus Pelethousia sp.]
MKYAAKSEQGKRIRNEDCLFIPTRPGEIPLAVVADGMGGHNAGGMASALAVEAVVTELKRGGMGSPEDLILAALAKANAAVYDYSLVTPNCRGMGTTLVLAMVFKTRYVAANIGDSRLYYFDGSSLLQITEDHSYVAELVAAGHITREEAMRHPKRNIITRALGTREQEQADIFKGNWGPGDRLMLCTDGLFGLLDEREMTRILREENDMDAACERLVELALYGGSTDNISVALIQNEEAQ